MKNTFYTQKEVMEMLDVSESTIRRWRNKKEIPQPTKIGRKVLGWKVEQFDKWFLAQ
jgi:predicted DNA-binding transcriptional regulator AlpA